MLRRLFWIIVAFTAALALSIVTGLANPGEKVNALWIIVATACVFSVNETHAAPALRLGDGMDYHPTNRWILFGHHFAAIAGAGPLIGPMLAAQFGYLPGLLWILIGSVTAGAVHDMVYHWPGSFLTTISYE
jgi:carbon starvation protein